MKRGLSVAVALSLVLAFVLGAVAYAQIKKDPKTGLDRIEGTIQSIAKDKSTLSLKQSTAQAAVWTVAYNDKTKITMQNKPATMDVVKAGARVIVEGKFADNVLTAARIEVRAEK
jgi:hypothetical protein